jgi:diguanylate cyclase (GGDEF)-like protein
MDVTTDAQRERPPPRRGPPRRPVLHAIRHRLAWNGYDPDAPTGDEARARVRGLVYLFLAGPALGVLTLALPHPSSVHTGAIVAAVLIGAALLVVTWTGFDRIGTRAQYLLLSAASLTITFADARSGLPPGAYTPFYYWVLLYAARYNTAPGAVGQLGLALSGLALSLLQAGDPASALVVWVHSAAAMTLVVVVVAGARRRVATVVDELARRSLTDALTGLRNRRSFFDRANAEAARLRRDGTPFALLLGDIDHFKDVNDTMGHAVGDAVLTRVARALAHEVREADAVYRIGGEEFAVLLPATDLPGAHALAEHLRASVARSSAVVADRVTMSFGVVVAEPGISEVPLLFRLADAALYEAKARGRDRVVLAPAGLVDTGDDDPTLADQFE